MLSATIEGERGGMTIHDAYHMRPWDEVLGPALEVEEHDGYCLALIGKIPVYLPQDLASRLREAKGQRIGILRTDNDYRFRVIAVKSSVGPNPLSIAEYA